MRDRPVDDNPHSLYHLYSYWDLKAKEASGAITSIDCTTVPGECRILGYPRVKVKDNWGWCNAGRDDISGNIEDPTQIDDCNQWVEFTGQIIVTEN